MHKLARTQLTLEKRIATLRYLLNHNASEYQVLKAATKLRDAKIQVLRATIGDMPSPTRTPDQNTYIAKLDERVSALRAQPLTQILQNFQELTAGPCDDGNLRDNSN